MLKYDLSKGNTMSRIFNPLVYISHGLSLLPPLFPKSQYYQISRYS